MPLNPAEPERSSPPPSARPTPADLAVCSVVLVPFAVLVHRFWFVCDDAFISFRYARNLAQGHGLRYNLDENPPVEGFSNFLWTVVCAALEWLGASITLWPTLVSTACGAALLFQTYRALRGPLAVGRVAAFLATLSLASFPPFALWSTSGLETMPFALLVFFAAERLIFHPAGPRVATGSLALLLLSMIRVEGAAWAAVLIILAALSRRLTGQRCMRPIARVGMIFALGFASYLAARYAYFGDLLPNTAYAKAQLDGPRLERGLNYVVSHILTFVTPLIVLPGTLVALRRERRPIGLAVAALAWAFPAYAIAVTGDFMPMGRFLVSGMPFAALLWGLFLAAPPGRAPTRARTISGALVTAALIVVAALPAWDLHVTPRAWREHFRFRYNIPNYDTEYGRWRAQRDNVETWSDWGRALRSYREQRRPPGEPTSVVLKAIGAPGYYSDLYVFDQYGLVCPEVAHRPLRPDEPLMSAGHDKVVPWRFFLKDRPHIIAFWLVRSADPSEAAAFMEAALRDPAYQSDELAVHYAPDFAAIPELGTSGERAYLLALARVPAGATMSSAWHAFSTRLERLRAGQPLTP